MAGVGRLRLWWLLRLWGTLGTAGPWLLVAVLLWVSPRVLSPPSVLARVLPALGSAAVFGTADAGVSAQWMLVFWCWVSWRLLETCWWGVPGRVLGVCRCWCCVSVSALVCRA